MVGKARSVGGNQDYYRKGLAGTVQWCCLCDPWESLYAAQEIWWTTWT